jgi:hypothetical protein
MEGEVSPLKATLPQKKRDLSEEVRAGPPLASRADQKTPILKNKPINSKNLALNLEIRDDLSLGESPTREQPKSGRNFLESRGLLREYLKNKGLAANSPEDTPSSQQLNRTANKEVFPFFFSMYNQPEPEAEQQELPDDLKIWTQFPVNDYHSLLVDPASPEKESPMDNLTVIHEQKSREYIHSNSDMSSGNLDINRRSGASPRGGKNLRHR